MSLISLLLPVRIIEEKFGNFERYFQSLVNCADNLRNLEVVVKFDDDQDSLEANSIINKFRKEGLEIKVVKSSRGNGYNDMYRFLKESLFATNSESKIIASQTIDGLFKKKGFDSILIDAGKIYEDEIFVIHPTGKFSLKTDVTDINRAVQHVECFPFWSRKWIEIQGGFGYNASSDGYTSLVEYFLYNEYGIDRRIDLSHEPLIHETNKEGVDTNYWNGPRRKAMEIHLSNQSINFARQAAKNIHFNIINSGNDKTNNHINYLIQSCLNAYDKGMILEKEVHKLRNSTNQQSYQRPKIKIFSSDKKIRRIQRAIFPPLLLYDKIIPILKKLSS